MRERRSSTRSAALAAAIDVAGIAGAPAAADGAVPRQTASFIYTSTMPGVPTGFSTAFEFTNPDDPNAKPYAVQQMVIRTPVGSGVDTSVRPQCHASDAELYAQGPDGCPADTKVGGGVALSDTGGSGSSRYSKATISNFNGDREIIGVGVVDSPPIKSVDHTKLDRNTSTTVFPVFPGFPPPEPYTPVKSLRESFPEYVHGGRAWARTPPSCPPSGYWTIVATFTYHDGVTQSVESHSPCARPSASGTAKPEKHKKHKKHRHHRRPRGKKGARYG